MTPPPSTRRVARLALSFVAAILGSACDFEHAKLVSCESHPDECDADNDGAIASSRGGNDCDDDDYGIHPGALEACDGIDNDCNEVIDDGCDDVVDGGCDDVIDHHCEEDLPFTHCVDFTDLDAFVGNEGFAVYETFDAERRFDLDQKTITFAPDVTHTRYLVTTSELDWDDDLGELVPADAGEDISECDDCFVSLSLDFPFTFFGTAYTTVFAGVNGYLTFRTGDDTYQEDPVLLLAGQPRISALWNDLDTRSEVHGVVDANVHYYMDQTKLVVTYRDILVFPSTGPSNTFQVVILEDGTIKISYRGIYDRTGSSLVGIAPGAQ